MRTTERENPSQTAHTTNFYKYWNARESDGATEADREQKWIKVKHDQVNENKITEQIYAILIDYPIYVLRKSQTDSWRIDIFRTFVRPLRFVRSRSRSQRTWTCSTDAIPFTSKWNIGVRRRSTNKSQAFRLYWFAWGKCSARVVWDVWWDAEWWVR